MQFEVALADPGATNATDGVNSTLFDFAFAGVLLVGTGLVYELAARKSADIAVGCEGAGPVLRAVDGREVEH